MYDDRYVAVLDNSQVFSVALQAGLNLEKDIAFIHIVADIVAEKGRTIGEWNYRESIEGTLLI